MTDQFPASLAISTEPRMVTAIARFAGPPGREREAAEAWAFELTYYFLRGVGEQPRVSYEKGTYVCTGLMTTTHPGDHDPTDFTPDMPWDLGFSTKPERQEMLRKLYATRQERYDGRA